MYNPKNNEMILQKNWKKKHKAQNRVQSSHKMHLLVVAHAHLISREVTKKIIEGTEVHLYITLQVSFV